MRTHALHDPGPIAGCSSLVDYNPRAKWGRKCATGVVESRRIPTITLEAALSLVPANLRVSHLKLDAQGADLAIINATPPDLLRSRVKQITLETRSGRCEPLYQGQPACEEVIAHMERIGFRGYEGPLPLPTRGPGSYNATRECAGLPGFSGTYKLWGDGCETSTSFWVN